MSFFLLFDHNNSGDYMIVRLGYVSISRTLEDIMSFHNITYTKYSEDYDVKKIDKVIKENFETLINMIKSDISAIDYNDKKYAIKFMLKYSDPSDSESRSTRAKFITPYGNEAESNFVADNYFAEDIKIYFDETKTDDNNSNAESQETQKNE